MTQSSRERLLNMRMLLHDSGRQYTATIADPFTAFAKVALKHGGIQLSREKKKKKIDPMQPSCLPPFITSYHSFPFSNIVRRPFVFALSLGSVRGIEQRMHIRGHAASPAAICQTFERKSSSWKLPSSVAWIGIAGRCEAIVKARRARFGWAG